MLKIAILGCGYWAAFQVAAWQAVGASAVAVWNRTKTRAEAFAKAWGIPRVFETAGDLFAWGEFDIADIITDVGGHEPLTLLAAAHGKPVICQKPMSYTYESCRRMVDACAAAGCWFAVHENFRYQPPAAQFIKAARSGVIGKPLHAQINMRSPDIELMAKQPALRAMPHMALRDMGPHIFDVARAAFGEMASMYALPVYSYRAEGVDVPDAAVCVMKAESGAAVSCNLVHEWNVNMTVAGEKGSVTLDRDNILRVRTGAGEQAVDTKDWKRLPYIPDEDWNLHGGHIMSAIPRCLADLAGSFQRGAPAPTSGADNLKTMELVFAAIESFETGQAVDIPI